MEDNKSMEVFAKAPIRKAVLQNALPAMAAMLMVLIYNLADTFFIGQTHDDLQVAAVSLATPVFLLFMSVGTVFGIGGTSVISRALGEGRRDYAKKVCSFCMWSCVAVGVLMSALFLIFMDQILALIGASAETWDYAKTYLTIVSCSGPFVLIANCYSNVIRAEGQSGKAMMGQLLGNLLNVILDPIMILVFGWNIAGAAIATVIGNVVSVVFFLIYFLRGKSILSISPGRYRVRGGIARGVITVGLPAAINSLLMSISNMLINVFLQAYGDNAVAAMGITMKANMLVVMLQLGLAQGVQPLVGYCYGANKLDRMRHSIRFSCVCNIVLGTVITVIYFIFTRQVVSVFIDDPAVIDYGVKMLRALMISGPVIGCMFVLNFSFQGMGKGTQSMILSLSRQGLIYFPLLIIMNKTVGLDGIIWSQAVADLVCTAMSVVMFLLVVRKLRRQHSQKTKA